MVRKRFLFFLVFISILILPAFVSAATLWDPPFSLANTEAYFNETFVLLTPQTVGWLMILLSSNMEVQQIWYLEISGIGGLFESPECYMLNWYIYDR